MKQWFFDFDNGLPENKQMQILKFPLNYLKTIQCYTELRMAITHTNVLCMTLS